MTKAFRVAAAIVLFSITNFFVNPVSARRMTAQAGSAPVPEQAPCFNFDFSAAAAGVYLRDVTFCRGGFLPYFWMIALSLDTSGTKTVQLTFKQTAANQLSCWLDEYNRSGALVQQVSYDPLPVANTYATSSKSITIATGNNLMASCAISGAAAGAPDARILSVEY